MDDTKPIATEHIDERLVYTVAEAGALLGAHGRALAYELVARGVSICGHCLRGLGRSDRPLAHTDKELAL